MLSGMTPNGHLREEFPCSGVIFKLTLFETALYDSSVWGGGGIFG
jgi:hypothetical protein